MRTLRQRLYVIYTKTNSTYFVVKSENVTLTCDGIYSAFECHQIYSFIPYSVQTKHYVNLE